MQSQNLPSSTPNNPDRLLALQGASNFRDLGGYRTSDRRMTRWRTVFRSGQLSAVTNSDRQLLSRLALRSAFDLRHPLEASQMPWISPPTGTDIYPVPFGVFQDQWHKSLIEQILSGEYTSVTVDDVGESYIRMAEHHGDTLRHLFQLLSEPSRIPAVFFCRLGKDRTGVVAALLLQLLGVMRDTILDDYELTNYYWSDERTQELRDALQTRGIDYENVAAGFVALRRGLEIMFDFIDQRYGSAEGFAADGLRLSLSTIAALQHNLLKTDD